MRHRRTEQRERQRQKHENSKAPERTTKEQKRCREIQYRRKKEASPTRGTPKHPHTRTHGDANVRAACRASKNRTEKTRNEEIDRQKIKIHVKKVSTREREWDVKGRKIICLLFLLFRSCHIPHFRVSVDAHLFVVLLLFFLV